MTTSKKATVKKKATGKKRGPKKTEIDLVKVEKLASQGLNKSQVAAMCGLKESQWYARENENPEITEAYKRGKAKGVLTISNALFEQARSGNTTAQIFFLKAQGGWRENIRLEHTGPDGEPIKQEITDARTQLLDRLARIAEREETE